MASHITVLVTGLAALNESANFLRFSPLSLDSSKACDICLLSPFQGRAPPSYRVKPMSSWSVEDTIVFFKECVTEKKKVLNNIRSKEVDGDLLRVMEDDELEEHVGLDGLMVKKLRKKMDGASVALSLRLFLCRQLDTPPYASLLTASFGCQTADSCVFWEAELL